MNRPWNMLYEEAAMKLYTCKSCRYIFRYPVIAVRCPDCGNRNVRPADKAETETYRRDQAVLAEEIRLGLYKAAAG